MNKNDADNGQLIETQDNPHVNEIPQNAMIITIGPPACGKTTWLAQNNVLDICLDHQPGVYIRIPRQDYLLAAAQYSKTRSSNNKAQRNVMYDNQQQYILQKYQRTMVHDKSLLERLTAPREGELVTLLQRLQETLSAHDLRTRLAPYAAPPVHGWLCDVVEEHLRRRPKSSSPMLPSTIDLFVFESLFRGGALERATQQLHNASASQSALIAWGNTNTLPRDYASALDAAWKQQRPVVFWLCAPIDNDDDDDMSANPTYNTLFDGHVPSFRVLLERSLERFLRTGRYVPAQTIWDMNERWKTTLLDVARAARREQELLDELEAGDTIMIHDDGAGDCGGSNDTFLLQSLLTNITKFDLHRQLAKSAGFEMDHNGRVRPIEGWQPSVNVQTTSRAAVNSATAVKGRYPAVRPTRASASPMTRTRAPTMDPTRSSGRESFARQGHPSSNSTGRTNGRIHNGTRDNLSGNHSTIVNRQPWGRRDTGHHSQRSTTRASPMMTQRGAAGRTLLPGRMNPWQRPPTIG
jgi:hypothetical protein